MDIYLIRHTQTATDPGQCYGHSDIALADSFSELTSRDLLHLAVCQINQIREIKTFDRSLLTAFKK